MSEIYKPTPEDKQRLIPKANMLKVSGDGVFATLQGEGITTGESAVFIRLHFCNLACGKSGGWQCDTGYTWDKNRQDFWEEPEDWSYQSTADKINTAWVDKFGETSNRRVVVTGGEPMLQQEKIIELTKLLPDWNVEIETNGTIDPLPELYNCQFNCSPKLENSGNTANRRYRPGVLRHINELPNSWFKFVVSSNEDLKEIDNIVEECHLKPEKILIMPEGQTAEEVEQHEILITNEVHKRNWNITKRNQLIWFGTKRRT